MVLGFSVSLTSRDKLADISILHHIYDCVKTYFPVYDDGLVWYTISIGKNLLHNITYETYKEVYSMKIPNNKPTNFSRSRLVKTLNTVLHREYEMKDDYDSLEERAIEDIGVAEMRKAILYRIDGMSIARTLLMREFGIEIEEVVSNGIS